MRQWGEKGKGSNGWKVRHTTSKVRNLEEGAETTVVLAGLPKTLNAEVLLQLLDEKFELQYDYFYLPMDMDKFENTGLAYINFRDHDTAVDCQQAFDGVSDWRGHTSERPCKAQWSSIQGYAANIERQQKSNWLTTNIPEDCKPMAFDQKGHRLPFLDVFPPSLADSAKDSKSWRTVYNKDEGKSWWGDEWYGGSSSDQPEGDNGRSRGWYDTWSRRDDDWHDNGHGSRSKWKDESSWRDWRTRRHEDWEEGDGAFSDARDSREASSHYDNDGWGGGTNQRIWRASNRYSDDANDDYGEASQTSDNYERGTDEKEEPMLWKRREEEKENERYPADADDNWAMKDKGKQIESSRELPLESMLGMASKEPPSLLSSADALATAKLAKYACPHCGAMFAKWSACQHHIVSEIRCRSIILDDGKLPANLTDLQDKCKAKAEEMAKDVKAGKPFADGAIMEKVRRFQ